MNKGLVKNVIKKAIFFSLLTLSSVPLHAGTTSHWGYSGKLPCNESLNWLVAKQKIQASAKQLTEFNRLLTANGQHHGNYRPVQNLNHRVIKEAVE